MFGYMWIKVADYVMQREQIASLTATVGLVEARINELTRENAALRHQVTGETPVAAQYILPRPEIKTAAAVDRETTMEDLVAGGAAAYEDMGDAAAQREGVRWDGDGRTVYGH